MFRSMLCIDLSLIERGGNVVSTIQYNSEEEIAYKYDARQIIGSTRGLDYFVARMKFSSQLGLEMVAGSHASIQITPMQRAQSPGRKNTFHRRIHLRLRVVQRHCKSSTPSVWLCLQHRTRFLSSKL